METNIRRLPASAYAAAEVEWYRKNGKYISERITLDSTGSEYVIGDWSWHRLRPDKQEWIDHKMQAMCEFGEHKKLW